MSWHPFERNRRLWSVYWEKRAAPSTPGAEEVIEFELTEPYTLDRDDWRDLQLEFLSRVAPADYTFNVSQLWSRLWPPDAALRFDRINEIFKVPIILSGELDQFEQPGKRRPFFWVLTQLGNDTTRLSEVVFFQNVDLENITWITPTPVAPWPDQLYEFNRAAFTWNRKLLPVSDFDQIIRQECWGMSLTHLGHLYFVTTRDRVSPEAIQQVVQDLAAKYNLELETTTYDQRPRKPGLVKALGNLPGNMLHEGWVQLKARNKRR